MSEQIEPAKRVNGKEEAALPCCTVLALGALCPCRLCHFPLTSFLAFIFSIKVPKGNEVGKASLYSLF